MAAIDSPTPNSNADSYDLAIALARAADDRKGGDLLILDVRDVSYLTDYFILVTGYSRVQVRALAEFMKKTTAEQLQRSPFNSDGNADAAWIVLDYGEVIAHIMTAEQRQYYALEAFWGHAARVELPEESQPSSRP